MWDTLKEIINKKTLIFFIRLSIIFLHEGVEMTGPKNIVDKFNEYFTEIGPILAPFNSYLTTPCAT